MDINLDGRMDLVFTGTQGQPFYDGWFVQVLLAQADGTYADATNSLMAAGDRFEGVAGASSGAPWGMWVKPLDFNYDGFMDFAIEMNGQPPRASTPLVWLNDGTGHFTTIKAGDITAELPRVGGGHWYETANGWSTIQAQGYQQGQLVLSGVTATQRYLDTPDSGLARTGGAGRDRLRGDDTANTLTGNGDIDTAVYFGQRDDFTVAGGGQGTFTVARDGIAADVDTLVTVERIEFRDKSVALDIEGHAGQVAKILGAVFGPEAVDNEVYAGIGLDLLDGGMSFEALLGLALGVAVGTHASHAAVVNLLYTNVVGVAPGAGELAAFTDLLDAGIFTQTSLAVLAANHDLNVGSIDLAGLAQTGLEYL
ncbi:MAG: VCBS repeat-containing protein [Burkholderiales bacterium]|nr:VCBS repeat-containing protein [Burkholderiales bacterium]